MGLICYSSVSHLDSYPQDMTPKPGYISDIQLSTKGIFSSSSEKIKRKCPIFITSQSISFGFSVWFSGVKFGVLALDVPLLLDIIWFAHLLFVFCFVFFLIEN